jgi:DNA topoisomerase-1
MRGSYDFVKNASMPFYSSDAAAKIVRTEAKEVFAERRPMSALQRMSGYVRVNDEWYLDGKLVNKNIATKLNKMAIPPAWTDVVVSTDPKAKVLAIGKDAAGRWQYKYNAKAVSDSAKKKFVRVKKFTKVIPKIEAGIEKGIKKGNDFAYLLDLENKTAIRVGTDRDFKAKVKAYGLTTLQYEHVAIKGDRIILDFTAKKGIHSHYELTDGRLAKWLKEKKELAGSKGNQLFPDITGNKLNRYLKELAKNNKYSVKDFRTYHATRIAKDELEQYAGREFTAKEKKAIVKSVTEKVSKFLYNTPIMAKNSYIDPMVWEYIGGL